MYAGNYKSGKKEGKGTFNYANGDVFTGEFHNKLKNGKGVMKYSDGDVYDGAWKDDKRHGACVYTFSNGDKYTGTYEDDVRCNGTMEYADGTINQNWNDYDTMSNNDFITPTPNSDQYAETLPSYSEGTDENRASDPPPPPPPEAKTAAVEEDPDLKTWLRSNKLPLDVYEKCKKQRITLALLPHLSDDDFERAGVSVGHKIKIRRLLSSSSDSPSTTRDGSDEKSSF